MKKTTKTKGFIMLTVAAVMLVMLTLCFLACRYTMKAETHVRYVGIMDVASEKIAKTISGMEMNAMNVFDEVEKHLESPDAVIAALHSKTSLNPDVNGYFAAFEPNYFPEKGRWFEPYVHKAENSNQFVMSQVGSARHDYTKSDWYVRAKERSMSFWSDPYYYYDGTSISGHYCTFVEPLYDAEGKLVCVCGADMTFEWLSKELKQIDYASKQDDLLNRYLLNKDLDFFTVVLNDDGTCLAHPEGKGVSMKDEHVISDLQQRKSGKVKMIVGGKSATVYYGPIRNIDWSVAVIVPNLNVLQPVIMTGVTLLVVMVLGLIVIWMLLKRKSYAEES